MTVDETIFEENQQTIEVSNNNAAASQQAETVESNNNEEEGDVEEPVEKLLDIIVAKQRLYDLAKQAIEKHPDLSENVRQLADMYPGNRKIFVHGFGTDATAETLTSTLTSVFSKYGELENCDVLTDEVTGEPTGSAFILFKRRSSLYLALKQPNKQIGNRMATSFQLASPRPVPAPQLYEDEYFKKKIFVRVSSDIESQKLVEFFKQFGEVDRFYICPQIGKPNNYCAQIVYKSVESAKKALEEPNKTFQGHTLYYKGSDNPFLRIRG